MQILWRLIHQESESFKKYKNEKAYIYNNVLNEDGMSSATVKYHEL